MREDYYYYPRDRSQFSVDFRACQRIISKIAKNDQSTSLLSLVVSYLKPTNCQHVRP